MKKTIQLLSFIILFTFITNSFLKAQISCPASGSADTDKEKQLNKAKNHTAKYYGNAKPFPMPLGRLIPAQKENDRNKFVPGLYVCTQGYMIDATEEGGESCNCDEATASAKSGDVHIYIGKKPGAKKSESLVVEITPSYKKLHPDYENKLTVGKEVKVYGYLLYDYLHEKNSVNFCKTCSGKSVWRKTCWEIHPVVKIETVE